MCREHERSRVLAVHRLFDVDDRLRPVLAEIVEDADEARPELGPAPLEMCPVDDVPSFAGHLLLLKRRVAPAVVHV
jgi:hypothetical protein